MLSGRKGQAVWRRPEQPSEALLAQAVPASRAGLLTRAIASLPLPRHDLHFSTIN